MLPCPGGRGWEVLILCIVAHAFLGSVGNRDVHIWGRFDVFLLLL